MNVMIFDTETTGLVNRHRPAGHESQPHLVQLGAMLVDIKEDEPPRTLAQLDLLVQPNGWDVPLVASEVHGITTEIAVRGGIALGVVLHSFVALLARADMMVAYNIDFDVLVLDAAACRAFPEAEALVWPDKTECVMRACTDICKLPSLHGKPGYKWPKLKEAYSHFFGREPAGQHTALGDCRATLEVWQAMRDEQDGEEA